MFSFLANPLTNQYVSDGGANMDSAAFSRAFVNKDERYRNERSEGRTRTEILWQVFHGNKEAMQESIDEGECKQEHDLYDFGILLKTTQQNSINEHKFRICILGVSVG